MAKCFGELSMVGKVSAEKDFTCVTYLENGSKIAAGSSDGLVRIYESESLTLVSTLGTPKEKSGDPSIPVTDVHPIPPRNETYRSYFIATYTNGYVKLWNIAKGKAAMTLDEQRQTLGIGFSALTPHFVTVGDDAAVYLYDEQTMSVVQTLKSSDTAGKIDGHTSRVFTVSFHPKNANEFITGGWDNTVQFWDMRRLNSMRHISGPHICGHGIDFKPGSGKEFITASYQKETPLQKWDYSSGKLLFNFEADMFRCMLYCGKWIEEEFIASGGTDPSLFRVMHIGSNSTIGYFRSQQTGVYSMDYKVIKAPPPTPPVGLTPTTSQTSQKAKKKTEEEQSFGVIRCVICAGRFVLEIDANLVNK